MRLMPMRRSSSFVPRRASASAGPTGSGRPAWSRNSSRMTSLAVRSSPQSTASASRSSGCRRTLTTSLRIVSFPLSRLPEATLSARGANHSPAGGAATSSLYHKLDYPAIMNDNYIFFNDLLRSTMHSQSRHHVTSIAARNCPPNNCPLLMRSLPAISRAIANYSLIIDT
ncbi:protein of unknown function (plasmid) [Shinella sp. WSC3-e]|nr:protein of unknown function [Shinella sp. WSC3-e]